MSFTYTLSTLMVYDPLSMRYAFYCWALTLYTDRVATEATSRETSFSQTANGGCFRKFWGHSPAPALGALKVFKPVHVSQPDHAKLVKSA
jgi:hypothetical protein